MLALFAAACALVHSRHEVLQEWKVEAAQPTLPDSALEPANAATTSSHGNEEAEVQRPWRMSGPEVWARWNALQGDAYALDARERFIDTTQKRVQCSPEELVVYRGTTLRYHAPLTVVPAFRDRLEQFEKVVEQVALEIYGRAPRRIQHYGAYSCRTSRQRKHRLSEHALGNALDVVGFDFGPATKLTPLNAGLPKRLSGAFQVRVAKHWLATGNEVSEVHARFLRTATDRLIERGDVFRGFVGPGHRGHADHFHFDMSPWRYVRL